MVNLFWFAYAADGVLSLIDELASKKTGLSVLNVARAALGLSVIVASLVMGGVVALTPRAPKRVLVPLILLTWWGGGALAFPLVLLKVPHLMLWLCGAQILSAAAVWLAFRDRSAKWYQPFALNDAPVFAWKHALIGAPAALAVAGGLAMVGLLGGIAGQVETMTGGYVRLRPDGVYLVERQFRSGDREVRLTGMMHIGGEDFYSSILPRGDHNRPSVVLVEGVTDNEGLLGPDALKYNRIAQLLNTDSQTDSSFTRRVRAGLHREEAGEEAPTGEASEDDGLWFKHADVDVATFHPKTIAFIVTMMSLMQAENWQQAIQIMTKPNSPINDEEAQNRVKEDVLEGRNAQLLEEIQTSLKDYQCVIVPWGAMHLPGIESWLRSREFEQSGEIERKALSFW